VWLHTTDTDAVLRATDTDAILREAVDLYKPTQDIVAYFPLYHHILHGVKRHFTSNEPHWLCFVSARWESYESVDAIACHHIVEFDAKERHSFSLFGSRQPFSILRIPSGGL